MCKEIVHFFYIKGFISVCTIAKTLENITTTWPDCSETSGSPPMNFRLVEVADYLDHDFHYMSIKINICFLEMESLVKYVIECRLQGIDISNLRGVNEKELILLIEHVPNLKELGVRLKQGDGQNCVDRLAKCTQLRRLLLRGGTTDNYPISINLKSLADAWHPINHLDIQGMDCSGATIIYFLYKMHHRLRSFACSTSGFSSSTNLVLHKCVHLERLSLDFQRSLYPIGKLVESICNSLQLKALSLKSCNHVKPSSLMKICKMKSPKNLRELDLSFYTHIDEEFASQIRIKFPNIEILRLNSCFKFQNTGLQQLLKLKHLFHLELAQISFSYDWFIGLLQCKKLIYLDLEKCKNLRDDCASQLVLRLPLEYLNISNCVSLTDNFLDDVESSKTLRRLFLYGCKFSHERVKTLKTNLILAVVGSDF